MTVSSDNRLAVLRIVMLAIGLVPIALSAQPARALDGAIDARDQCVATASSSWSSTERWVWQSLCLNDNADFSDSDAPKNNTISADFLEEIVESNPYRSALQGTIYIDGADVTGELNLEYVVVEHPLWLQDCNFDSKVDLEGIRVPDLSLYGSTFYRALEMDDVHVDESLEMDSAKFGDSVDLSDSIIGGHLSAPGIRSPSGGPVKRFDVSDTRVESYLDFSNMHADTLDMANAALGDRLEATSADFKNVDLTNVKVGASAILNAVHAVSLDARGMSIEHNLFLRDGATIKKLFLTGTSVTGQVDITPKAQFGFFSGYGMRIGGQFFLRSSQAGRFRLDSAVIGGDVELTDDSLDDLILTGTSVTGRLLLKNVRVKGGCECERLSVGGDLPFVNSKFGGTLSLRALENHGTLTLAGGHYNFVDLSTAHISGDLVLIAGRTSMWLDGSTLSLRNASAQAFEDRSNRCASVGPGCADPWPNHLDLDGFSYQELGALTQNQPALQSAHVLSTRDPVQNQQDSDMAVRSVTWWRDWLHRGNFSIQPYEQLAAVLRQVGHPEEATQVLVAGKDEEVARTPYPAKFFLLLDKAFVGYGYRPYYALYWTILMILIGVAVLNGFGERRRLTRAAPPDAPDPFPLGGLVYSFDKLVPLVTLYKPDDDVQLRGGTQYYFWVHRIVGYVLASFLIAALSGLTK